MFELTIAKKQIPPCERELKIVLENSVFYCVLFCFRSLGRFERCVTVMAVEAADSICSVTASACHIGGPIGVNPGELVLVYGTYMFKNFILKRGYLQGN